MRPLLPALAITLAACSSSASPTSPADAAADVADAPHEAGWDGGPVDGAGWTITPPPGLRLVRHDAPPPVEWWTFADSSGALAFTVNVSDYSGTMAEFMAWCDAPGWGYHCADTGQSFAYGGRVLRLTRDAEDGGVTAPTWRYVAIVGGRFWEIDMADTIDATARQAAAASFAVR